MLLCFLGGWVLCLESVLCSFIVIMVCVLEGLIMLVIMFLFVVL